MGGGAFSFQLFGFPIEIHTSFLAIVGIIGYSSAQGDLPLTLAFLVIAVLAVLIHELGHAFAARSLGTQEGPMISLAGMAGLTRYRPASPPTRAQSIWVSFAGPLAGITLGIAIYLLWLADLVERTAFVDDLYLIGFFTTFGWSAFNLLPVVPLDGGHIMTDMLPGDPRARQRRAAIVSIAIAVVLGFFLWNAGIIFGALLVAMFAFQNITILNSSRTSSTVAPPPIVRDDEVDLTKD